MQEHLKKIEQEFIAYVKKMEAYEEALGLMYWDLRTGAPKLGREQRSKVIGLLSSELFQMSISEEMAAYIANLGNGHRLSTMTEKVLQQCKKNYDRNKKIPVDIHEQYIVLKSQAENVWEEAKANADFELFQPYLEKLVEYNKEFIKYWGYKGNKYNALLDIYEPGITVELLDQVFSELRLEVISLLHKVDVSANKLETDFLYQYFPKEKQKAFGLKILEQMGYDLNAGRLDETIHPFAIGLNPGDVRVTTRYNEYDWKMAVFGIIHEGGHALYEQNISDELVGTPLCSGASMGIHESQSLFYENIVGRDYSFWKKNYPLLKQYANGSLDNTSLEDFYRAINETKPSLIRIEADELTYPLHIIIRYELEKGLFNDEISVADLPQLWNDKYEEYLGIRPENDAEGVLQDVHWAGGDFGYFPSYAIGFMYAAQFRHALIKELPYFDLLESGDLQPIRHWLTNNVHQFGKSKKPLEILEAATGEGLNAEYLIDYLQNKYTKIYRL